MGVFQSGAIGYHLPRHRVMNLDGVVNPAALAAMKQNRLSEYLRREDIHWIADWDWIIDALLLRASGGPDPAAEWEQVTRSGKMMIYRRRAAPASHGEGQAP